MADTREARERSERAREARERGGNTGAEREPPLGYLSRAARAVRRSYPPVSSRSLIPSSFVATAAAASSLQRPTDPHTPFPRWHTARLHPTAIRPRVREPHCDDQEGLVTSIPVFLFLRSPPLPPIRILLHHPQPSSRVASFSLPSSSSTWFYSACNPLSLVYVASFFFLV